MTSPARPCPTCGEVFIPKDERRNRPGRYCSRRCAAIVGGASHRGKRQSPELIAKRAAALRGEKSPAWKADEAGYHTIHAWLCKNFPKSRLCEECAAGGPTDYALIHGRDYSRDREDYRELCRPCHIVYDHDPERVAA
jgi:hypothetical protein